MNLAAVGSSRNRGRGSSRLGKSPAKMGTLRGASAYSHSMIRSKKVRTNPSFWQMVAADASCPGDLPGRAARANLNDSMW